MATKYVTLKDSNGDTLYPQAVATNLAPDSIPQSEIDFSTIDKAQMTYQPRSIAANKDLNTAEFLDLTGYVCDTNAKAATISNSPTSSAFIMEVKSFGPYSKIGTDAWANRIRTVTSLYGDQWTQIVQGSETPGSVTYGSWKKSLISSVSTSEIDSKAVTSAKIADGVLEYKAGDTITLNSGDFHYFAGRTRTSGSNKYVWFFVQLDKPIQSGRSVTFTPSGYQEVFGPSGAIISVNNPSSSVMTFTTWTSSQSRSCIQVQMNILDSTPITGNLCCSVHIGGVFTIS